MQYFIILASLCSCVGWFEPYVVKTIEGRFSTVVAQLWYKCQPNYAKGVTSSLYAVSFFSHRGNIV